MKKYDEGEKSPSASDITRFEFVKSASDSFGKIVIFD